MLNIHKRSWLGLSLSLAAILGVTACSSNEDSSTQAQNKVAVTESAPANQGTTASASTTTATTSLTNSTDIDDQEVAAEVVVSQTEILDPDDVFLGRKVYLRGEMNDYGVQDAYELKEVEEDTYCTLAPLRADWSPYRFKFADKDWTAGTNFGFAVPPAVMREGSARVQLNPNSRFEEIRYEPAQDGIYRFCIEIEDKVPYASVNFMEESRLTTMKDVIKRGIDRMHAQHYQLEQDELLAKAQDSASKEVLALEGVEDVKNAEDTDVMEVAAVASESQDVATN